MKRLLTLCLAACALAVSTPAYVHHSGAMFDRNKVITITGTITEFRWMNPHSSFKLDVLNSQGDAEVWAVEMNSPNNLVRLGWKRTTLKKGDKVTVKINPLRNGQLGGWYQSITLPDGKVLDGEPPSN